MSNVTATPALADLSSLGKQIELDRSASVHELRQRDHAIGLQCDASDDVSRLLFWLKSMPDHVSPAKEAQTGWFSEDSAATVMRFLAIVLGFMGMAGLGGMLRRTIYLNGEFNLYMILAGICGGLLLLAFLAFFYNIVMSLGLKGVIGIFTPSKLNVKDLVPSE